MVIDEQIIAALGQLAEILINKPLDSRVLRRNGKCLVDLQRAFTEGMRFDIVTIKVCIGADGSIKA